MKKCQKMMCAALIATFSVSSVLAVASCYKEPPLTDVALAGSMLADFTQGEAETFFASDGWCNGDVFNVTWDAENVAYENGAMKLSITDAPAVEAPADTEEDGDEAVVIPYLAGEARSYQYFGYGDYTVKMKPAKVMGTASTFFVCTGDYDTDEEGNPNPHDEIDIEFLGYDTTRVQFNYFVNGVGGHEHMYDLGFDASAEYHEYGFRWAEDYIVWFVDGKPVYKVEAKGNDAMPCTAGRILMNHWCGTEEAEGWMKEYTGSNGVTSDYAWVKTSATPIGTLPTEPEQPEIGEVPETGWEDISVAGFDGWGAYDVDKTQGLTVSHTERQDQWKCCGMDLKDSYSWVKFTLKNNSQSAAEMRIDVKDKTEGGRIEAVSADNAEAKLLASDNAAIINMEAGQTSQIIFKIKNAAVNQFVLFLNSISASGRAEAGSITITDLKGVVNSDIEKPEPPAPPVGENYSLSFSTTETYTVDKNGEPAEEINVTYTAAQGGKYANIQADVSAYAADKNTFSLKAVNNGEKELNLRIDLIGENTVTVGANKAMNVCNLSATSTGGSGLRTDTEWGGTMLTLAAGEEATVIIVYSNELAMGAVQRVQLYMDSSIGVDTETHSGSVTFGEFKFTESEVSGPVIPEGEGSALTFTSTTEYSVDKSGEAAKVITVTYNDLAGNTYRNIVADIAALAVGKDTFTLKIANNGKDAVRVRIDINGTTGITSGDNEHLLACNVSQTNDGGRDVYTDTEWGGTHLYIDAGKLVTLTIKYDETAATGAVTQLLVYLDSSIGDETLRSGSISLGDFNFSKSGTDEPVNPPEQPDNPKPEEPAFDIPVDGWINASLEKFDGWDRYTIERFTEDFSDTMRIIHGKAIDFNGCCGMVLDKSYTYIKFTVKNNIGLTAYLRIEFCMAGQEGSGAVIGVLPADAASVDTAVNAALITVAANDIVDVVIKLDPDKQINQMTVFLNSLEESGNPESGNISISSFKAIVNEKFSEAPAAPDVPADGWTEIDTAEFSGWDMYTVDKTEGLTISHDTVRGEWNCCGMDLPLNYHWIKFTIKNNMQSTAKLRIDVKENKEGVQKGAIIAAYPESVANVMANEAAAALTLNAGQTVNVVLKLDAKYFNQIVFFLNSIGSDRAAAGSVTVTGLSGIVNPDIEHKAPSPDSTVALSFKSNSSYTVDKSEQSSESVNVTYNGVNRQCYANIWADVQEIAGNYNTFSIKLKNNGSNEVLFRIALNREWVNVDEKKENLNVCNQSSEPQGGYSDGRGGSYYTLGANQEVTLTIKYNPDGGCKQLVIYIDSSKKDDNTSCSGNVTLSEFKFSNT